MKRRQLVELEDLPWWPRVVRDLATDYLAFMESSFGLYGPAVALIREALQRSGNTRIVDLCSGGGGPTPQIVDALRKERLDVTAVLTDRFPNIDAFTRTVAHSQGAITFEQESVDARSVPAFLTGVRTIHNAFHHFDPRMASEVLRDAYDARQPIGVFEVPDRKLSIVIMTGLLTPFIVLLATPFIRPFTWQRFFWTYIMPLVPLTCLWDGVVSGLRAYTDREMYALTDEMRDGYEWHAGRAKIDGMPAAITYLMGLPYDVAAR
jgi:hypothetical protein